MYDVQQVNEDRLLLVPRLLGNSRLNLYGVFDGHAGHRASDYCKDSMAQRVTSHLVSRVADATALTPEEGVGLFHAVFNETDEGFLEGARANQWEDGTTACVVMVNGDDLFCANAGDSKAVLVRFGATLPLSSEHKPGNPSELRRIQEAGGVVEKIAGVCRVNGNLATSVRAGMGLGFGSSCRRGRLLSLFPL